MRGMMKPPNFLYGDFRPGAAGDGAMIGAHAGTRTRTPMAADFKSAVSTIPPRGPMVRPEGFEPPT